MDRQWIRFVAVTGSRLDRRSAIVPGRMVGSVERRWIQSGAWRFTRFHRHLAILERVGRLAPVGRSAILLHAKGLPQRARVVGEDERLLVNADDMLRNLRIGLAAIVHRAHIRLALGRCPRTVRTTGWARRCWAHHTTLRRRARRCVWLLGDKGLARREMAVWVEETLRLAGRAWALRRRLGLVLPRRASRAGAL